MNGILYRLFQNIAYLYKGKNLLWQGIMVAVTSVIVLSGFDWWYYTTTRYEPLQLVGFTAGLLGFLVPLLIVFILFVLGDVLKNRVYKTAAAATAQAGILALAVTSFYKVFTGRIGLPHDIFTDTSHMFRFGILRGGAFQGWPSSHTAVAFAMSFALIYMFPKNKVLKVVMIIYALFIGIGASVAFHWFSDFAAGLILGPMIGITVGKAFYQKSSSQQ